MSTFDNSVIRRIESLTILFLSRESLIFWQISKSLYWTCILQSVSWKNSVDWLVKLVSLETLCHGTPELDIINIYILLLISRKKVLPLSLSNSYITLVTNDRSCNLQRIGGNYFVAEPCSSSDLFSTFCVLSLNLTIRLISVFKPLKSVSTGLKNYIHNPHNNTKG